MKFTLYLQALFWYRNKCVLFLIISLHKVSEDYMGQELWITLSALKMQNIIKFDQAAENWSGSHYQCLIEWFM